MSAFGSHNSEASTSTNFLLGTFSSHQNSSKYRAYASAVDKALKSFESTTEWADLIAALGKLGKVFASNSKSFNDIPNPLTVAKRLSQCLHPALPSGVHLKALETYRQVFNILGHSGHNQNLARSLFLYAIGLFPLIDHCGIKVKSELLSIFEAATSSPWRHSIFGRPSPAFFITAVLLAPLEEGTAFYGRAFQLLDQFAGQSRHRRHSTLVFGRMSVAVLRCVLPALIFINAKLEKRKSTQPAAELLHTLAGGGEAAASVTVAECHQQQAGEPNPCERQMKREFKRKTNCHFFCFFHMWHAHCEPYARDAGATSALAPAPSAPTFCVAQFPLDSAWLPRAEKLIQTAPPVHVRRGCGPRHEPEQTTSTSGCLNRSVSTNGGGLVAKRATPQNVAGRKAQMTWRYAGLPQYTLPLIKSAIREYLHCADTVEVPPLSTATIRRYVHSVERPANPIPGSARLSPAPLHVGPTGAWPNGVGGEFGGTCWRTVCARDAELVHDLQGECAKFLSQISSTFGRAAHNGQWTTNRGRTERYQMRSKKNFKCVVNSLEARGFVCELLQKDIREVSGTGGAIVYHSTSSSRRQNRQQEGQLIKSPQQACVRRFSSSSSRVGRTASFSLDVGILVVRKRAVGTSHGDIRRTALAPAGFTPCWLPAWTDKLYLMIKSRQQLSMTDMLVHVWPTLCPCRRLIGGEIHAEQPVHGVRANPRRHAFDGSPGSTKKGHIKCKRGSRNSWSVVWPPVFALLAVLLRLVIARQRERRLFGGVYWSPLFALMRELWPTLSFPFYSLSTASTRNNYLPFAHLSGTKPQSQQQDADMAVGSVLRLHSWNPPSWFQLHQDALLTFVLLQSQAVRPVAVHVSFGPPTPFCGRTTAAARNTYHQNQQQKHKTTHHGSLLKAVHSPWADLQRIDQEALCRKAAAVLWRRFADDDGTGMDIAADTLLHPIALLLLRLHSRRVSETSSEVEDIVVAELTSSNKVLSGSAVRKFHDLWVFCRSAVIEEVYAGILLKPMNRVVMVLLSFIADDKLSAEQVELKALAYAWFLDCAHHNELHKIVQMLTLMLLNPVTARVSIQFVQMQKRVTRDHLPSMPAEANCVALTTVSGKQTFHHVCTDVEQQRRHCGSGGGVREQMRNSVSSNKSGNSWYNYSFVDCDPRMAWVSDLNKYLLLGGTNCNSSDNGEFSFSSAFTSGGTCFNTPLQQQQQHGHVFNTRNLSSPPPNCGGGGLGMFMSAQQQLQHNNNHSPVPSIASPSIVIGASGGNVTNNTIVTSASSAKGHRRTVSDIPQFDDDAESVDAYSMDTSMLDSDVVETVQYLVDSVCDIDGDEKEEEDESKQGIVEGDEDTDELEELATNMLDQALLDETQGANANPLETKLKKRRCSTDRQGLLTNGNVSLPPLHGTQLMMTRQAWSAHCLDPVTQQRQCLGSLPTLAGTPSDGFGQGHRRQDSLQESIFSTGTQELRLFDPTELPNSTCPGDHKQPLLDETFSHMLFYAESPSIVDLGRAEKAVPHHGHTVAAVAMVWAVIW
ncbi:hypothetical protein niasHT_026488 [Heterodera trifolii]|uniref:DOP1 N-terminal domain-containing protein n=1 Tax=Heterodera trifolii TaxID=157864 RepID=A0ABD2JSD0_9BILA